METISGTVFNVRYEGSDGYKVVDFKSDSYNNTFRVVGNFPPVDINKKLVIDGEWFMHYRHGREFRVGCVQEKLPSTEDGMFNYLCSGRINGIGPVYARKMLDTFGKKVFDVLDNEPERLLEIGGIGKKTLEKIEMSWKEQRKGRNVIIALCSLGVSVADALKVYEKYEDVSVEVIKKNPYRLADEIRGIGFSKADKIALNMGFAIDSEFRIQSALLYTLKEAMKNGHCFQKEDVLIRDASKLTGCNVQKIAAGLKNMIMIRKVVVDYQDAVYLPKCYKEERYVADKLMRLANTKEEYDEYAVDAIVENAVENSKTTYNDIQIQAIRTALTSKLMVLTGGPGTGKTTVTKAIVSVFERLGYSILLAAPTGRAAKRMNEAIGRDASTIHRMLQWRGDNLFAKNEDDPLEEDVLIIDESSMIDLWLMDKVLRAVPKHMKVILIGDFAQLPSVGAGNVLRDIIESEAIPVITLNIIYRQSESSKIITNAHQVIQGKMIDFHNDKNGDFFVIRRDSNEEIEDTIVHLCSKVIPECYKFDPLSDIQVLSPMKKEGAPCSSSALNEKLQNVLNPKGISISFDQKEFRKGDKVIQMCNDYNKWVFNGDVGIIVDVCKGRGLSVQFPDQKVFYENSELVQLSLAYAITIHKSQGSEYPVVIIPMTTSHTIMLQRNLLYTAITRAKQLCILVGSDIAIMRSIENDKSQLRNTHLRDRIEESFMFG